MIDRVGWDNDRFLWSNVENENFTEFSLNPQFCARRYLTPPVKHLLKI